MEAAPAAGVIERERLTAEMAFRGSADDRGSMSSSLDAPGPRVHQAQDPPRRQPHDGAYRHVSFVDNRYMFLLSTYKKCLCLTTYIIEYQPMKYRTVNLCYPICTYVATAYST